MSDLVQFVVDDVVVKAFYECLAVLINLLFSTRRLSLMMLSLSAVAAYLLYTFERDRRDEPYSFFGDFLRLREVYWHPSARRDYVWIFILPVVHAVVLLPIHLALFAPLVVSADQLAAVLDALLGALPPRAPTWAEMAAYGLVTLMANDLRHYWVHRVFHRVPALWEFHKVHHSAEVLVPPTALRIHPVEDIAERITMALMNIALFSGVIFVYGSKITPLQIVSMNYLVFISNAAAANLRHTHIWLSFGPRLEYVFNSPAQHQIHHSADPAHYDKNFAVHLSIWDWMFGTLYVTTPQREEMEFGLGEAENKNYRGLGALMFYPFKGAWMALTGALPAPNSSGAPDA